MTSHLLVVELPDAQVLRALSPNGRAHWAVRRQARQNLQERVQAAVAAAGWPRCGAGRVRVQATYRFPVRRQRDPDNLTALLKAVLDALVRLRVLRGDTTRHCVLLPVAVDDARGPAQLTLVLEEEEA